MLKPIIMKSSLGSASNFTQTLLLCLILALIAACSSKQSLNTYEGSLSDLLPEKVGNYQKRITPRKPSFKNLRHKDQLVVNYESSGEAPVTLEALNFPSPETAKYALQILHKELNQRGGKVTDREPKDKGGTAVGERFVATFEATDQAVVWTNGSVLFLLNPNPKDGSLDKAFTFEKNFPY